MSHNSRIWLSLLLATVAASCKENKSGGGADLSAPINATLPKEVASVVTFETRTIKDKGFTARAAVPVGWVEDVFPGNLKPPKDKNLGFMTRFSIGTDCDGACVAKDWKPIVEKKLAQSIPDDAKGGEENLPNNGRIRWGIKESFNKKTGYVYAAWYKEGDSRYRTCSAWLDDEHLAASIDAFVAACKTVAFQ